MFSLKNDSWIFRCSESPLAYPSKVFDKLNGNTIRSYIQMLVCKQKCHLKVKNLVECVICFTYLAIARKLWESFYAGNLKRLSERILLSANWRVVAANISAKQYCIILYRKDFIKEVLTTFLLCPVPLCWHQLLTPKQISTNRVRVQRIYLPVHKMVRHRMW